MLKSKIDTYLLHSSFQYYIVPFLVTYFSWSLTTQMNPCFLLWVIHVLIPLMDCLFPLDHRNPTKEEIKQLENQLKFKFPLYLSVILDWCTLLYFQNWIYYNIANMSYLQIIFLVLSAGYSGSSNINIAHELLHKNNILDKFMGLSTLSKNMYLHFYIEHVHGHHRRVATPEDPTSSRKNETLYQFLPRTIIGSWISAWKYEEKRLGTKEFTLNNRMHLFTICYVAIPSLIKIFFGWTGLIFFLISAFISVIFLETINYIEHYGLERKEITPGVYEKVDIKHSWNAPHRFTNYLLFKLQRHSDHHENGYKPYQTLCSYDQSPFLPHGYTVCLLLATNSEAWFDVMNEMLDDYKIGKNVSEEGLKKRNWKIYKVLLHHGLVFTTLWIMELAGLMKLI